MKVTTHCSTNTDAAAAARELAQNLGAIEPGLVVFFASSNFPPETLATAMAENFKGAKTVGCTTAGEIGGGKMLKNSLVGMAFSKEAVPVFDVAVLTGLSENPRSVVRGAFDQFEKTFQIGSHELAFEEYLGLVMVDGLSRAEEAMMDAIGDMTNVQFIGGSAGDDLKFEKTWVFANGKAYSNAAVLTILKPEMKFEVLKTQSFEITDKTLKVTSCDEAQRRVHQFNGEPAAEVYGNLVGCGPDGASDFFMHNPVGLMVGDEPFVRSPQQIQGSEMVFYCNVKEGMELQLLSSKDIIVDTKRDLEESVKNNGPISAILNFHCILRTLELENNNTTEAYGALFENTPTVGFSTYGEQFIGHINQTSTMVLFR